MLCCIGCDRATRAAAPVPSDELTYPIPAEGLSVKRVVEDAERILGKKIPCSECALAQSRPIKIAGLPRAPRTDALRLFQAIFMTVQLSLVEPYGGELRSFWNAWTPAGARFAEVDAFGLTTSPPSRETIS
jgi:hypothetical protein